MKKAGRESLLEFGRERHSREEMEKSGKSEVALRRCAKAALLLHSFYSSNSQHQVKTFSLSLSLCVSH